MYSDPDVVRLVSDRFLPVRVHVKENPEDYKRLGGMFDAQWTPTTLVVDGTPKERHRLEGFLPKNDFASQLELGLGKTAFGREAFGEAEEVFEDVLRKYPDTDAAAEAQYWAGVSRYKMSGDPQALKDTARRFKERHADSTWAKKASVWG